MRHKQYAGYSGLVGLRWGKTSLSQVVAMLIERWDELDDGVKVEIAELLRRR